MLIVSGYSENNSSHRWIIFCTLRQPLELTFGPTSMVRVQFYCKSIHPSSSINVLVRGGNNAYLSKRTFGVFSNPNETTTTTYTNEWS
jgi:hypothetical protein